MINRASGNQLATITMVTPGKKKDIDNKKREHQTVVLLKSTRIILIYSRTITVKTGLLRQPSLFPASS
jgi:hypothetical protein